MRKFCNFIETIVTMKEFIYFFKHKNINAVKIGRTSGDTVFQRFSQFKIYSPFGAELIGYFECTDCVTFEKEIHKRFEHFRLHGEWFNISEEQVIDIINEHDNSFEGIKKIIIEYLADPECDIDKLKSLLKASKEKHVPVLYKNHALIYNLLPEEFELKDALKITDKNNIPAPTVKIFIGRKLGVWFEKISRGKYRKISNRNVIT